MPILAGQTITAQQLNRLQPKTYRAAATAPLAGAATNADVPGATITLNTETANAVYVIDAVFDYRITGASAITLGSGNVAIDGGIQSEYAVFRDAHAGAGSGSSVGQTYRGTIPTPGSHTLKLVASPIAGQQVNVYSSITVTIYEVV